MGIKGADSGVKYHFFFPFFSFLGLCWRLLKTIYILLLLFGFNSEIHAKAIRVLLVLWSWCNSRMFRIEACSLVLVLFSLWFVYCKTQHHMLRHKTQPFLLVQNEDLEAYGLGCWVEMLIGLSSISGFSCVVV